MANRRIKPLRWTMELAAVEFGKDHRALSRRIRAANIQPAADGCFSTADITRIIFGDKHSEDLRKVREEADKLELQNKKARGELISADAVYRHFEAYFILIRKRILDSKLSRDEQDDLLRELQSINYDEVKAARIGAAEGADEVAEDSDSSSEDDGAGMGGKAPDSVEGS